MGWLFVLKKDAIVNKIISVNENIIPEKHLIVFNKSFKSLNKIRCF